MIVVISWIKNSVSNGFCTLLTELRIKLGGVWCLGVVNGAQRFCIVEGLAPIGRKVPLLIKINPVSIHNSLVFENFEETSKEFGNNIRLILRICKKLRVVREVSSKVLFLDQVLTDQQESEIENSLLRWIFGAATKNVEATSFHTIASRIGDHVT